MIQGKGTNPEINQNENQSAQNNQSKSFSRLNNYQTNQRAKQEINKSTNKANNLKLANQLVFLKSGTMLIGS